jgi:hypothetical protein
MVPPNSLLLSMACARLVGFKGDTFIIMVSRSLEAPGPERSSGKRNGRARQMSADLPCQVHYARVAALIPSYLK